MNSYIQKDKYNPEDGSKNNLVFDSIIIICSIIALLLVSHILF
jgi:hypothetical protein